MIRILNKTTQIIAATFFSVFVTLQAQELINTETTTSEELSTALPGADEELVSLHLMDAKLQDALRSLAALRPGVNLVMGPEVKGNIALLTLNDVTWETALRMVAEAADLKIIKMQENMYRVEKSITQPKGDVDVTLLRPEDIDQMSDEKVRSLVQTGSTVGVVRPIEELRTELKNRSGDFIHHLYVEEVSGIKVISEIARLAGLDFSVKKTATPEARKEEANTPQTSTPVTMNLGSINVVDVMLLIASQAGLTCSQQSGVWVVAPIPPNQIVEAPLIMEAFSINFLPIDTSLVDLLKGVATSRAKITPGRNKIIIVQDTRDGLEAVRRAIEVMDIATPQVLIEARFFKVSGSFDKTLGFDWSDIGGKESGKGVDITATPGGSWGAEADNPSGNTSDFNNLRDIVKTTTFTPGDFQFILKALQEDNDTKQLANPKVLVSSEKQAMIHIGLQQPIIKSEVDNSGSSPTTKTSLDDNFGGASNAPVSLVDGSTIAGGYTAYSGYLDLGTKLTVAPSVKTDDEVYIKVVPELTSVDGSIIAPDGNAYPILFATRVFTEFTIKSGQTIAIGGLVNDNETTTTTKVPVLGDIPLLGRLFRYDITGNDRSETIVFLTVKVVPSGKVNTSTAVPVRARFVQEELEKIEIEDAKGAVYDYKEGKKALAEKRRLEAEEEAKKWTVEKLKKTMKEHFPRKQAPADAEVESSMEGSMESSDLEPIPVDEAATTDDFVRARMRRKLDKKLEASKE